MDENCTVYKTVDVIGKKWSLLIILSIYKGKNKKMQYSEIKKELKTITPKILSKRLKELTDDEILIKEIDTQKVPLNTYYLLSESGKKLIPIIQDIKKWGLMFKFNNKECETTFCRQCKF